ncbi:glycosyltransferase [Anaeromyxobacter sp. K]|uniref:glycosyltransferase n=1 Tax=Anaeromyxobacter sp. (strain K) TaxID=447217 RepID=UPI002100D961|nr:glycosyltransferase [Anaeromyxobacter sp. K]
MNRGGVETWLMHILRNSDPRRFAFDFLVQTDEPSAYDDEILQRGSRIIRCPHPRSALYPARLLASLRRFGPYDVVHSHVHHFSGVVLFVARLSGIPVRIAHSHSALTPSALLRRKVYARVSRWLLSTSATRGLAVSELAAASLFGPDWRVDDRWSVQHLAIDLLPFRQQANDFGTVRHELGIPANAYVLGHVGRFDTPKNHRFLLEIAAATMRSRPEVWLLLVGGGPLRPAIEHAARSLGIERRVVFAGIRADIPRLLCSCMDVFVMPSLYEGLPLSVLEAQAAGLPVVMSDAITPEAIVIPSQCRRLALSSPLEAWTSAALSAQRIDLLTAVTALETSSFGLQRSLQHLAALYGAR